MSASSGKTRRTGLLFLIGAGTVELALLAGAAWWPGRGFPWPGLAWVTTAFVVYALVGWRIARSDADHESRRVQAAVLWVFALTFRLALLPVPPELSDDIYRYLWDGHVQLEGVNPYAYAPADPALERLQTPEHGLINNPDIRTIYPPLAQLAFVLVGLGGGTIFVAKALWVLLDLATAWLLTRVADRTGRDPLLVLALYAWSPLLVIEVAWNGHLEPLGLAPIALLLYWRPNPIRAGIALALAALAKFAPIAALPPLVARYGWRFAAAVAVTLGALYLPYLGAGKMLFAGLGTFAEHWRFQEGAFGVLELLFPGPLRPRILAGATVVAVVAWTTWRRFDPERALFWILGAGLLLSHTIHPWYVLWALPFAALRVSVPWLLLSALVFLGYWGLETYHATGLWPQPTWARVLLWAPVWSWLVYDLARSLSGSRAPEPIR